MKKLLLFILIMAILLLAMLPAVALAADGTDPGEGTLDVWGYIKDGAYVLIPVLYIIGLFLKKIPKIPDWLIPIVLLCLGIILAMAVIGWTVEGAIQGILVAGTAVFANQIWKQVNKGIDGTG